jgi:hypothetical protein
MPLWLPEIVRERPSAPLALRWVVSDPATPRLPESTIVAAVAHAGARLVDRRPGAWTLLLPWQTLVYGIVRREVDERVLIQLAQDGEGWTLRLSCPATETHAAHATGAAGIAVMAAAAWLVGGWTGGILPAAATALAGGLWADATRVVAMGRLELRLRRLIEDIGLALWPDAPAQLLPPPTRPSL